MAICANKGGRVNVARESIGDQSNPHGSAGGYTFVERHKLVDSVLSIDRNIYTLKVWKYHIIIEIL